MRDILRKDWWLRRHGPGRAKGAIRSSLGAGLAVAVVATSVLSATPAMAAPVHEIVGEWAADTPTSVAHGDVVTGVWKVNVNDDAAAPSNDDVDNVNFSVILDNGIFTEIPNVCLVEAVDPVSSISDDGRTLLCNLGTQQQGTATAVHAPFQVDGQTGDEVTATGTIGTESVALDPLTIENKFMMDMRFGNATNTVNEVADGSFLIDYQWSLDLGKYSEAGPNSVTYRLNMTPGTHVVGGVTITPDVLVGPDACSAFTTGKAAGHPWSGGGHDASQTAPFVTTCALVANGNGTLDLTLTGIDYSLAQVPTQDSMGVTMPVDRSVVASGSVQFRVNNAADKGSLRLASNAPTYTSVNGSTSVDDASNNTSAKTWTIGSWPSAWRPEGSGLKTPTWWSNQFLAPVGTTVESFVNGQWGTETHEDIAAFGQCVILDTEYVTFDSANMGYGWNGPALAGQVIEYYVGSAGVVDPAHANYDPSLFDCGATPGTWTTQIPADLSTVKAVRVSYPFSSARGANALPLQVNQTVKLDTPVGQDVWMWGQALQSGTWSSINRTSTDASTETPGLRYPFMTNGQDVLRIVAAQPAVKKSVDRLIVETGVPATYTLRYSANIAGPLPESVDNFKLVDTLPQGMSYVPGSSTPEPTLSQNGDGRDVLTWTINGLPTNVERVQTYQLVADETVAPGKTLTNSAVASVSGANTVASTAKVTMSSSGYTTISKTADAQFIPNLAGDGKGSGSWTVLLRSYDPLPQAFTDTIDILPYLGDGRGTSFMGGYVLEPVTAVAGATVYYTAADPASLTDDPADVSNGAAGTVAGNTVGWSTTFDPNATAVRVVGPELAPGAQQSFKVPVVTDGAEGGDQLVNRAQARDEHTELVMRTSAPISIANYYSATLKKFVQDVEGNWHDANDASDYPTFQYGDTVKYRIVATNTGQGTLTNIDVSDDKNPDLGSFMVDSLAPGESQTHEFETELDESVGGSIVNTACAAADIPADSGVAATIPCDQAGIDIVGYSVEKTSDPASGSTVQSGDVIEYTITVTQRGPIDAPAEFQDTLAGVTDDTEYNDDLAADLGDVTFADGVIDWSGVLPVGGVAKVTYSVTVKDAAELAAEGDSLIDNVITSPGCEALEDCTTHHEAGSYVFSKTSDPAPGSDVLPGERITYTVKVEQMGAVAQSDVVLTDDLGDVLDDATWVGNESADSGTLTRDGDELTWIGDLAVGQVVTITYSVDVTAAGNMTIGNLVSSDGGACVPADDQNPECKTVHQTGDFTYSKMSDPTSPSTVQIGDTITYTVEVLQQGTAGVPGATLTDDLTGVLDDATWNDDAVASAGTVSRDGDTLVWAGDLAVGDVVTITYSVTVAGAGDTTIENVVTTPPGSPVGKCVPAADGTPGCETVHKYGGYMYSKTSNPRSGTAVKAGDTIDYTVTVTQAGAAATDGVVIDDLSDVLDDAEWVGNEAATSGELTREGDELIWVGDLEVGQVVTITYSVNVTAKGDQTIANVVTSPDAEAACVPAADQNPDCRTQHTITPPSLSVTGADMAALAIGGGVLLMLGLGLMLRRRRSVA